jgi:hypothetical protein
MFRKISGATDPLKSLLVPQTASQTFWYRELPHSLSDATELPGEADPSPKLPHTFSLGRIQTR